MNANMKNYAVWAVALLVIGVMFQQFLASGTFGGGLLVRSSDTTEDTLTVQWRGEIGPPFLRTFNAALNKHGEGKSRIVLVLDSPGGLAGYGARIIRRLDDLKKQVRIDTVVETGDSCMSMCVAIYLQGQTRYASPSARFMMHEVSTHDMLSDRRIRMPRAEREAATDQLYLKYFEPAGVSPQWMRQLRTEIRGRDVFRSGRQLVDEKSGVVTNLL